MRKIRMRIAAVLFIAMAASSLTAGLFVLESADHLQADQFVLIYFSAAFVIVVVTVFILCYRMMTKQVLKAALRRHSLNRITENENRLTTVLDNLISAVVMIDKDEQFVLLNKAAEDMLGIQADEFLGKHFSSIQIHDEIFALMTACRTKQEIIRSEVVMRYPIERTLDVNMVPIAVSDEDWAGMVIVLHDISEIRRLEKIRSEFVANVSHELKTPIASVKGFAETLLSGAVKDEETARSFLQIIFDESDRLNRLILDILELSKIESKRVPLNFSPIELSSFMKKTISMLESEAEKKGIRLITHVEEEMYIEADEDRLQQVVLNLISNGINYTGEQGTVTVSTSYEQSDHPNQQETVQIIVEDTGIGIPKKDLPRIFERFYRVDKARSRGSGGTGLGLSIVKHIIETHRGTIKVESEQGEGTRFIIHLPVIQ